MKKTSVANSQITSEVIVKENYQYNFSECNFLNNYESFIYCQNNIILAPREKLDKKVTIYGEGGSVQLVDCTTNAQDGAVKLKGQFAKIVIDDTQFSFSGSARLIDVKFSGHTDYGVPMNIDKSEIDEIFMGSGSALIGPHCKIGYLRTLDFCNLYVSSFDSIAGALDVHCAALTILYHNDGDDLSCEELMDLISFKGTENRKKSKIFSLSEWVPGGTVRFIKLSDGGSNLTHIFFKNTRSCQWKLAPEPSFSIEIDEQEAAIHGYQFT